MNHDLTGMAHVKEGMVRVAPLRHIPEVLSAFGLPIEPLFDDVGLPRNVFTRPENTVPVEAIAQLLALCAERAKCPHFGLLAGQKAMPASLGLIGLSMLHSINVGAALRGLILTLHLNGRAVVPALVVRDDMAVFSLSLYGDFTVGAQQVADFTIAIACTLMRAMCGPKWVPGEVLFSHRAPGDRRPYSRFFKAPLRFGADHTALVFPSSWLAHCVPGASRDMRKTLHQGIAVLLSQQDFDLLTKVRRALFALIVQDDVSVGGVATMLGMHRRTLNRRLAEQGTTIAKVLNEVRFQLARQLLSETELPFVEIAATLNYTDASTFTRAFRVWSGTTPTLWRAGSRGRYQERPSVGTMCNGLQPGHSRNSGLITSRTGRPVTTTGRRRRRGVV
jgi:AraC-like DNA-binding protein